MERYQIFGRVFPYTSKRFIKHQFLWSDLCFEEAISRTMEDRKEFQKRIFEIAKNDPKRPKHLDDMLRSLGIYDKEGLKQ